MARSADWEDVPMAVGDPKPAWPLPSVTPKFATWSFGGGRPFGCAEEKCERWHVGVDLTGAPDGALVVSPEDAVVVAIDHGWSEGSKAAFLRAHSGLFLVLGGFKAGSHKAYGIIAGQPVKKGDKLGAVLGSYGMIHLETYAADSRTANSVWWRGQPPPKGMLNPTNYIERMVGGKVSLVQTRQRLEALRTLGFYTGDLNAPWGDASVQALRAAQRSLGITVDGKWGPETEDAIQRALVAKGGCVGAECGAVDEAVERATSTGRRVLLVAGGIAATVAAIVGVRRVLHRGEQDIEER